MKIIGDLDNMKIVAPSLRPFSTREMTTCPACGISASNQWRKFLRKIRGKREELVVSMRYCPGDKPPTEEPSVFSLMMGSGDRANQCSGIPVPHLHVKCGHCNAEWFTALKEAR